MDILVQFIQENVAWAPYIVFFSLLLAGFNIPVSEDMLLFICGVLAAKNPDQSVLLFCSVFFGAYLSDLICYSVGRFLGPKIWSHKFFSKIASKEKVDKLNDYYKKYGPLTLFLGRFIPFGVRNALFLTAGLGKMNFRKFAFFDFLACLLSCTVFFNLYFYYGTTVIEYVKKGNIIVFSMACLVVGGFLVAKRRKKSVG